MEVRCKCKAAVERCVSCEAYVCPYYEDDGYHNRTHKEDCNENLDLEVYCLCGKVTAICDSCEQYVCFYYQDNDEHDHFHKEDCEKKPKRSKRTRKQTNKEYDQSMYEKIDTVSKKRNESRKKQKKTLTVILECEDNQEVAEKKFEDKQEITGKKIKRDPDPPKGETKKQIEFLETFAVVRDKCTCYKDSSDWEKSCYESKEKAEEAINNALKEAKNTSQQCNAYSLLEKDGQYLVLITNSEHKKVKKKKKEITEDKEPEKLLRPPKEPELSESFTGSKEYGRFYAVKSCDVCDQVVFKEESFLNKDSFLIKSEEDLENIPLTTFIKPENDPKDVYRLGLVKKIENTSSHFGYHCRIVFIKKIQTNEKKNAQVKVQDGWTLHHSEMESLFNAKRRGWNIVKICIDRDCCKTCASTLGKFAKEVHDVIEFF